MEENQDVLFSYGKSRCKPQGGIDQASSKMSSVTPIGSNVGGSSGIYTKTSKAVTILA